MICPIGQRTYFTHPPLPQERNERLLKIWRYFMKTTYFSCEKHLLGIGKEIWGTKCFTGWKEMRKNVCCNVCASSKYCIYVLLYVRRWCISYTVLLHICASSYIYVPYVHPSVNWMCCIYSDPKMDINMSLAIIRTPFIYIKKVLLSPI